MEHILTDVNGNKVIISSEELRKFTGIKTVYGMDLPTILALRNEYECRGGYMPMTPQSVVKAFNQD